MAVIRSVETEPGQARHLEVLEGRYRADGVVVTQACTFIATANLTPKIYASYFI